ncbi:MAG: hypothetical protein Q8934_09070 [Bacillota bacterium]|nr:hypothetical protein [Bacillota bacterium]
MNPNNPIDIMVQNQKQVEKFVNPDILRNINREWTQSISPLMLGISINQQHLQEFSSKMASALDSINQSQIIFSKAALEAIKTKNSLLNSIFASIKLVEDRHINLISYISNINKKNQDLFKSMKDYLDLSIHHGINFTIMNQFVSTISSVLNNDVLDIDFSDLDELNITSNPAEPSQSINVAESDLAGTFVVRTPKKKLIDMTEEDLTNLIKKCINPKTKTFAIGTYIYTLYSEYVNEAARVLIEIIFVVCISFITGHYDAHLKAAIKDRITETTTVQDLRKVITRYIKFNPYGQLAFVRKDSYIREGISKNSPLTINTKVSIRTPLTILDRRGNWLKVEIDDGNSHGEIGWIQESAVVKYKIVK